MGLCQGCSRAGEKPAPDFWAPLHASVVSSKRCPAVFFASSLSILVNVVLWSGVLSFLGERKKISFSSPLPCKRPTETTGLSGNRKHWQRWYANICQMQRLSNLIYLSRHLCCVHHHGIWVPGVMQWLSVRTVDKIQTFQLPAPRQVLERRSLCCSPSVCAHPHPALVPSQQCSQWPLWALPRPLYPIHHSKWEASWATSIPWDMDLSTHSRDEGMQRSILDLPLAWLPGSHFTSILTWRLPFHLFRTAHVHTQPAENTRSTSYHSPERN